MSLVARIFEPQNMKLGFEVWVLVLTIVFFTTYFLKLVTDIATPLLGALLVGGAFLGNVAARGLELVPATPNITVDIVLDSVYASFAGMFATMVCWFVYRLVLPGLIQPHVLQRANQPKGVVGQFK